MLKGFVCVSVCFFLSMFCSAQISDSAKIKMEFVFPYSIHQMGLEIGINQFDNSFFELGVYNLNGNVSRCAFGSGFTMVSLNAQYNPFGKVAGLDMGLSANAALIWVLGLHLQTYTDFNKILYGIRPEIGFGGLRASLSYGYNFLFNNTSENTLEGINVHEVSLRVLFGLK